MPAQLFQPILQPGLFLPPWQPTPYVLEQHAPTPPWQGVIDETILPPSYQTFPFEPLDRQIMMMR